MCMLEVMETDDSFEALTDGYDYLVDFLDLSFPKKRPDREHSYIEVRRGKATTHSIGWLLEMFQCKHIKDTKGTREVNHFDITVTN